MADRERAAELADEIEKIIAGYNRTYVVGRSLHSETEKKLTPKNEAVLVAALRIYAAPPRRDEGLRYSMREAMLTHLRDSVALDYAVGAAISAIHAGGFVVLPRDPTEAQRLAFETQPGNWFDKMRAALAAVEVK